MAKAVAKQDPARFNLKSFADLISTHKVIIGEDPDAYDAFHDGMVQSLAPATPHECVIAENLIAIEWDLLQHQRMRNASLRQLTQSAISEAVVANRKGVQAGLANEIGNDDAALAEAMDLGRRAVSSDPKTRVSAHEEITALGMNPIEVMSGAYRTSGSSVGHHDTEIQQLERRRRDVKRDYDALQKVRPIDAPVVEASLIQETPVKPKKKANWV